MYTCILIDDEPAATQSLEILLNETGKTVVLDKINESKRAVEQIVELKPDLVFLDIDMPEPDGFEIMDQLINLQINTRIVFVTAYNNYVLKALRMGAFDYIYKPLARKDIQQMINRFEIIKNDENLHQKFNKFKEVPLLKLPIRNQTKYISVLDIVFLKADGNYTKITFTDNAQELSSYNLGWFEKNINSNKFIRTSRSMLININYMKEFDKSERKCILEYESNSKIIDVSRRNCPIIRDLLEKQI